MGDPVAYDAGAGGPVSSRAGRMHAYGLYGEMPTSTELSLALEDATRSRRRRRWALVISLVLVVGAAIAAFVIYGTTKVDDVVGTWGFSTVEIDAADREGLSEAQLERFDEARSMAALVMQGCYVTAEEDGSARIEVLGSALEARWSRDDQGEYNIEIDGQSAASEEVEVLENLDIHAQSMHGWFTEEGKLALSVSDEASAAQLGYRTFALFERANPDDKVGNALFDSASKLKESVLGDAIDPPSASSWVFPKAYADEGPAPQEDQQPIVEGDRNIAECMRILGATFAVTPKAERVEDAVDTLKLKSLRRADVAVEDCTYDGTEQKPEVTVVFEGEDLKPGVDFDVTYANNVDAGTASVVIAGKDKYYGSVERTFAIARAPLDDATVTGVDKEYVDLGEPIEPEPKVESGKRALERDVDFSVKYEGNDQVGDARVLIEGIGNYEGTLEVPFAIVPDNAEPVIDYGLMMVDVHHFNIADLSAQLSTDVTRYKASDIVWTVEDSSIASFWDGHDGFATEMVGEGVTVQGHAFGTTSVTATLPNGNSSSCSFRVMTSCKDSSVGSLYTWIKRSFYLVEGSWGSEYVEAYVNNADRMVKSHPTYANFEKDVPERTVYGYWQSDLSISWPEGSSKFQVSGHKHHWNKAKGNWFNDETVLVKPEGELSTNDWLLLQTSKNQWEYLLHKEDGFWRIVDEREGSAGPHYESFNGYMGVVFNSQWGLAATIGSNKRGQTLKSILVHSGGAQGRPTTHGCIALGNYGSQLYYDTFVLAGMGTRVIAY